MVTNGQNFTVMGAFCSHLEGFSGAKETPQIREELPKIRGKQYLLKGVIHTPPTKTGIDSHRRTYRD